MATPQSFRRLTLRFAAPLFAFLSLVGGAAAQPYEADDGYDGSGVTYLIDWPRTLMEAAESVASHDDLYDRLYSAELLPFIDTLALGYSYAIEQEQPVLSFAIDWGRDAFGILDGRKVHKALMPEDVRLTGIDLRASVHVTGRPAADLFIVVDSLDLAPRPELYLFDLFDLTWDQLFDGVDADSARAIFEAGFTLADLEILQIQFDAFELAVGVARTGPRRPRSAERRPEPIIVDDWHGGIFVHIGSRTPRRPAAGPIRGDQVGRGRPGDSGVIRGGSDDGQKPGTRTGRGDASPGASDQPAVRSGDEEERTRTERTKSGRRFPFPTGSDEDDDEDDEDDTSMVPAALAGAAAVAVFAAAGGTVGYYGNAKAPIGLSAGHARPRGGFLLQVGVNPAALGSNGDVGRLLGRGVIFFDAFGSPIQPSFSFGVLAEKIDGEAEVRPDAGLGLVGNFGTQLLQVGYDFMAGGVDFGIAFNFKHRPARGR